MFSAALIYSVTAEGKINSNRVISGEETANVSVQVTQVARFSMFTILDIDINIDIFHNK